MNGYNARVNHRQFFGGAGEAFFPTEFYTPDMTIDTIQTITVGGISCQLYPGMGETDDVIWGYFPDNGVLFTGDLIIWEYLMQAIPKKPSDRLRIGQWHCVKWRNYIPRSLFLVMDSQYWVKIGCNKP